MPSKGGQKEINELKKLVISNGFKLVPNGAGHWRLLNRKGAVVVDKDGPVILSSTASDMRARDMHVKRLLAVGALKADPWKPDQKIEDRPEGEQPKRGRGFDPDAIKRAHEVQAAQSRERAAKTAQLRARVEPFIAAIGGWEKKGVPTEFARAAYVFLRDGNRVEVWGSESSALQNMHQLKVGNTMGEKALAAWHLFMDEIERAGDTIDDRRARYFDLVRQSKGLATTAQQVMPAPEPEQPKVEQRVEPRGGEVVVDWQAPAVAVNGNGGYEGRVPDLALRALAEMMGQVDPLVVGSDDRKQAALEIAKEILDMEINTMLGITTGVKVGAE